MNVPNGYVEAERVSGVVKVPDRYTLDDEFIQGSIVGPGDTAVIPEGEAHESDLWSVVEAPDAVKAPAPAIKQSVASTTVKKNEGGKD